MLAVIREGRTEGRAMVVGISLLPKINLAHMPVQPVPDGEGDFAFAAEAVRHGCAASKNQHGWTWRGCAGHVPVQVAFVRRPDPLSVEQAGRPTRPALQHMHACILVLSAADIQLFVAS